MGADIKSGVPIGCRTSLAVSPPLTYKKSNRCSIIRTSGRCETRLHRPQITIIQNQQLPQRRSGRDNNLDYFKIWPSQANGNADEPQICVDIRLNSLVQTNSIVVISSISVGIFTSSVPGES